MKREKTSDPEIVKYSSGVFYFRHGSREISLKVKDFKEAQKRKAILKKKFDLLSDASFTKKLNDSFVEHLAARRAEEKRGSISDKTLEEFESLFKNHILPHIGTQRLFKLNSRLFIDLTSKLKIADMSNIRKVMGVHLRWCAVQGYIASIPILIIPEHKRRKRRILTPDEILAIFSHAEGDLLLFLSMALFMGMRRKEIRFLNWNKNVDLVNRAIRLHSEDTKTRRHRPVPISNRVMPQLLKRFKSRKGVWVFPNKKDPARHGDVAGLRKAWFRCLKDAGMEGEDITWHDLRATHQSYTHKRSDFTDTQREKFSGSSIDVQKRVYVSFEADDIRALAEAVDIPRLDEAMGKTRGKKNLKLPEGGEK